MKSFYKPTIIISVIIICISCSDKMQKDSFDKLQKGIVEKNKVDIKNVDDVLKNLTIKPQTFQVDPTKESIIYCGNGTGIFIPANVLVFEDGSFPKGPVNIAVTECYSISQMIGMHLTTKCGNDLLVSGGMINIKAENNGKQLEIVQGKSISVSFRDIMTNDSMNIFYNPLVGDTVENWMPDYVDAESKNSLNAMLEGMKSLMVPDSLMGSLNETLPSKIENLPDSLYELYPSISEWFCSGREDAIYTSNPDQNANFFDFLMDRKKFSKTELEKFYDKKLSGEVKFDVDANGHFINIQIANSGSKNNLSDRVISIMESISAFNSERGGDSLFKLFGFDSHYSITFDVNRRVNSAAYRKYYKSKFKEFTKDASNKFKENDLNDIAYAVTNLGWINCDRFLNEPGEKINFYVNGKISEGVNLSLIFSGIKSILPATQAGDRLYFPNVPLNKKVKVVALKCENGKPLMCVLNTKTSKNPLGISEFKPTTFEEIEKALNE